MTTNVDSTRGESQRYAPLTRNPLAPLKHAPEVADRGPRVEDSVSALVAALADTDANTRLDAISDLALLQDVRSESLLATASLGDPAPRVRAEALYSLGARRAEAQLATVQLALMDPDVDVRQAAIGALQDIGGAASGEILRTALVDTNAAIRTAAAEALSEIEAQ